LCFRIEDHAGLAPPARQIDVKNRAAAGRIGKGRISRATPDGYTIGIGQWGTNVATGAIYKLPYDLMKDFEPTGLIATQPFFIVARKTMPANTLKELVLIRFRHTDTKCRQ
jgi:tripartite-type tricarboxylate transporter receptor subunit TctC